MARSPRLFLVSSLFLIAGLHGEDSYLDKVFTKVQSGICEYDEANDGQPEADVVVTASMEKTAAGWKVGSSQFKERAECERLCAEDSGWCHFIAFEDSGQFDNNASKGGNCYLFNRCKPSLASEFSDYSVYKESDNCKLDGIWNTNFGELIVQGSKGSYGVGGKLSGVALDEDGLTVSGTWQSQSGFGQFALEFGKMCGSVSGAFQQGGASIPWSGSKIGGTCLHGEDFTSCGRTWDCAPTCADPNPGCLAEASKKCIARCQCPPDKPILHSGHCIGDDECPVCLSLNVYGDDASFDYELCPVNDANEPSGDCATGGSEGLRCNDVVPQDGAAYRLKVTGQLNSQVSPAFTFKWGTNFLYAGSKTESLTTERLTNDPNCLRVIIEPDSYKEDIAWKLTGPTPDSTVVARGDWRGNACVEVSPDGCYEFQITDEYGDGMNQGEGTYFLAWGSQLWESPTNGDYGQEELVSACGSDAGGDGDGGTCLAINIKGDDYPDDVNWNLFEAKGTTDALASGDGAAGLSCFTPTAGECYTFEINDKFGDGLCCQRGPGGYTVTWGGETVATSKFENKAQERVMVCDPDRPCLEVQIVPDRYPEDVTWKVKKWNGAVVAEGGSVGSQCIETDENDLVFEIKDTYGDGICCGSGTGGYKVIWNGEVVASGGEFDYEETKNISRPSAVGGEVAQRQKYLNIKIVPDRYPADVEWSLIEDRTQKSIANGRRDANVRVPEASPGQSYTLRITDGYGDGICCSWGRGYAEVTWDGDVLEAYKPTSSDKYDVKELKFTVPSADDTGCLKVDIVSDTYPEDVHWELADNITGERVTQGDAEGVACHKTQAGTCYEFRIYDDYGDGLGLGAGSYSVTWAGKEWHSRSHGDYGSSEITYGICDPDTQVRVAQYEEVHSVILVGHSWETDDMDYFKGVLEGQGICYYTIYLDREHDRVDLTDAFKQYYFEKANNVEFPFLIIGGNPTTRQQVQGVVASRRLTSSVQAAGGAVGDKCKSVYNKLQCIIDTNAVVVIGRTWCGYTKKAIQHMIDNKICATIIQFDALGDFQTPVFNYLKLKYAYYTTPYVFIGGNHVKSDNGQGGYYSMVGNWRGTGGIWQEGNGPMVKMLEDSGAKTGGSCGDVTTKAKSDAQGKITSGGPDASIWWDSYECESDG